MPQLKSFCRCILSLVCVLLYTNGGVVLANFQYLKTIYVPTRSINYPGVLSIDRPFISNTIVYLGDDTATIVYDWINDNHIPAATGQAGFYTGFGGSKDNSVFISARSSGINIYANHVYISSMNPTQTVFSPHIYKNGTAFISVIENNNNGNFGCIFQFDFQSGQKIHCPIPGANDTEIAMSSDRLGFVVLAHLQIFKYQYNGTDWINTLNSTLTIPYTGFIWASVAISGDDSIVYITTRTGLLQIRQFSDFSLIQTKDISSCSFNWHLEVLDNGNSECLIWQSLNSVSNESQVRMYNYKTQECKTFSLPNSLGGYYTGQYFDPILKKLAVFYYNSGYYTYKLACPSGSNYSTIQAECIQCHASCSECFQNTFICIACLNPTHVSLGNGTFCGVEQEQSNPSISYENECIQGFYQTLDQQNQTICKPCAYYAESCEISATNYTKLKPWYQYNTQTGQVQVSLVISILSAIYSTPTLRTSFTIFSQLFLNFDNLWLYQYHKRLYGVNMNYFFQAIRQIQDKKFSLFGIVAIDDQIYFWVTDNICPGILHSAYEKVTTQKFLNLERKNFSFVLNLIDYFFISMPLAVTIFIFMRWLFIKLQRYQCSSYIRKYYFWSYLIICLLQPNIQYLCFLSTNQVRMAFQTDYNSKIMLIFWGFIFGITVFFLSGIYFLIYHTVGVLSKYFIENCYRMTVSFIWYTYQIGIQNLINGFIHSFLYENEYLQLLMLISVHIISIIFTLYCWKKEEIFKSKVKVGFIIINKFLFIAFQVLLIIQLQTVNLQEQIQVLADNLQFQTVCCIFIANFILSAIMICQGFAIPTKYRGQQSNYNNIVEKIMQKTVKQKLEQGKRMQKDRKQHFKSARAKQDDKDSNKNSDNKKPNLKININEKQQRKAIKRDNEYNRNWQGNQNPNRIILKNGPFSLIIPNVPQSRQEQTKMIYQKYRKNHIKLSSIKGQSKYKSLKMNWLKRVDQQQQENMEIRQL